MRFFLFWILILAGSALGTNKGLAVPPKTKPAVIQTYWVDATGDNSTLCTQELPCQTISHALTLAADGDVIRIKPGIYREQLDISHSGLTVEGDAAGVFIFGAAKPLLSEAEGRYVADWPWGDSFKGTTFCSNLTNDVSVDEDYCNTVGFWQDGIRLEQVLSKANVTAGTFYYDFEEEEVWLLPVAGNADLNTIEGLTHPYTVRLTAFSSNVTLQRLNIWYGASMPDDGILQVEGAGHVITDVDVRYSAGAGILVYGADQVLMEGVESSQHGQNGWRIRADASFSSSTGWEINDWVDDLQLTQSVSRNNGWKGFDNCWGGGGTKFSFTRHLSIHGFYSADNNGFGIWLDIENHDYIIEQSLSARDTGRGMFVEYISDNGTVENNIVFGTKDADDIGCGISVGLAAADSRNVLIKNNTVYSTDNDVKGIMLKTGCSTCRSFPYPSESIAWENNLLINKDAAGFVRDLDAGTADTFTFLDTRIEEEFAGDGSVLVCWDGLGNCSKEALGIEALAPGIYLADVADECGFEVTSGQLPNAGAQAFVHPQASEICEDPPAPIAPVADFEFAISNLTVQFTDTSLDDGTIIDWTWHFGDGTESAEQHPEHVYSEAGIYVVMLTVVDDENLSATTEQTVDVEETQGDVPPIAAFSYEVDILEVTFTDESIDEDGMVELWHWDFGDGSTSPDQHPAHLYSEGGSYVIMLEVTDNDGLTDSTITEIAVEAAQTGTGAFLEEDGQVVMEAEHYTQRFTNLETGDAWLLQETNFNGEDVAAMQALDDDGHIIYSDYKTANAEMTFPVLFNSTGTFYIWMRVWSLEDGSTVYVGAGGQSMRMGVAAQIVPGSSWTWCSMKNGGRRAQFSVTEAGEKAFSIWMREDGLFIDRIVLSTDPDYEPTGVGPDESPREVIFGSIQPGPSLKDQITPSQLSAHPDDFVVAAVYPNPVTNTLKLSLDLPEAGNLIGGIFDLLGKKVGVTEQQFLSAGGNRNVTLDVSTLPAGTYLYRFILGNNTTFKEVNGKFVVAR